MLTTPKFDQFLENLIKRQKYFFTYLIDTHSKTTFIVTIISLLNHFFQSSLVCIDDCEVSSLAVVEVRFGGRSSDFYGTVLVLIPVVTVIISSVILVCTGTSMK